MITKTCFKRARDSDKLVFPKFTKLGGHSISESTKFPGPKDMGKMLVFEGMIFLQNYSTKQHPMYESPKDPYYPDDNISLVVSINDIDMVVSLITFRTDKSWIREFRGSVPVPPRSKMTIKLK